MGRVRYHRLFAADLSSARHWYERQRDRLGEELLACVKDSIATLIENPLHGKRIKTNVFRVLTKRFPYAVYYRLQEDSIDVIGIRHVHRKPLKRFRVIDR